MELRGNAGEPSIAPASAGGEDGKAVDTSTKLLEKVLDRENLNHAYKRVVKNGGSPGVDGMTVEELLPYLKRHGESLRQQVTGREVPAAAGTQGRDTQTGWRSKTIGDTNSSRPDDTTGNSSGTNPAIRERVFWTQLRISTRTQCTSGHQSRHGST